MIAHYISVRDIWLDGDGGARYGTGPSGQLTSRYPLDHDRGPSRTWDGRSDWEPPGPIYFGDRFPDAYGPAISSFDRFLPPYVLVINLSFSRDQSTRSVAQRALDDLISWTLECQP